MSRDEPVETDSLLGKSVDVDEYHDAEDEFEAEGGNAEEKNSRDGQTKSGSQPTVGGVKPKIRKVEEGKKRRKVLQKALSMAQVLPDTGLPQAVKEKAKGRRMSVDVAQKFGPDKPPVTKELSVEQVEDSKKPREPEPRREAEEPQRRTCPEFFGVKSYLHTFYESVSVNSPGAYDESGDPEYRYLIAPSGKRRSACLWRIAFYSGVNLLAFGLVMILIGYLVPKRAMVVGHEADMEIIDKTALKFNKNLDLCKLVGLIVFCLGGTILVAVLLFPSLVSGYCEDETIVSAEAFRVAINGYPEPPATPTEKKVPATEELSSIQPKRESDEGDVVMTNSGLCKIP